MVKSHSFVSFALPLALTLGMSGCSDSGPAAPTGPFDLTFSGDVSFQAPHGGQKLYVLLQGSDGTVIAYDTATVSATQDPAFFFTFPAALQKGAGYGLLYWIDSNFGGGTEGVCDPKETDHQWRIDLGDVEADVSVSDQHRPSETQDVCSAFAFDLTFTGDASFQAPHGGQKVRVALVDEGIGQIVARDSAVVSTTVDPAFSFDFPRVLVRGVSYHLDYWIDSNFGGGSEGVCDPVSNDHQWRISFGPVDGNVTLADSHRPSETQSVCSTFQ